jgi:HEAT repeat protein
MPLIRNVPPQAGSSPLASTISRAALSEGSRDERWAAVRAWPITPGGVEALSQALAGEADTRVREAMFTRLAKAATPEAVSAVLPHLRSGDAGVRTGALDALRAMPQAVEPHLEGLLADADPDVRLLACEIVREMSGPKATSLLCALLEREIQTNVCAAAVDVLAEIGGADALPVLARLSERFSDERFLVFAIKMASQRIGDQSSSAREPRA